MHNTHFNLEIRNPGITAVSCFDLHLEHLSLPAQTFPNQEIAFPSPWGDKSRVHHRSYFFPQLLIPRLSRYLLRLTALNSILRAKSSV
jgi:hypothetical protein